MSQRSGFTEGKSIIKSGKLVKVWARFRDNEIIDISITGDFFIYPENAIEKLEKNLRGTDINKSKGVIEETLKNCEYIGIDAKALEKAVMEAWMMRK